LELDLISQGNSAPHALDMIAEAIEICAEENVKDGRPPLTFRSAPPEVWELASSAEEEVATRIVHLPQAPVPDDVTLAPRVIQRAS
jgi:hypothetical protein